MLEKFILTWFISLSFNHLIQTNHGEWLSYLKEHSINLEYTDETRAKNNWMENVRFIQEHNSKNTGFKLAVNQFAHLSDEEFRDKYLSSKKKIKSRTSQDIHESYFLKSLINDFFDFGIDWTNNHAVTPVKDQKKCQSCWAFSAIGAIESRHYIMHNNLLVASEQELVDCSSSFGNMGCRGGLMDNAFKYVKFNGLALNSDYPYVARDETCRKNSTNRVFKISSLVDIAAGDENELKNALKHGPVSVAIDASTREFRFYKSGIFYSSTCSSTDLDHGVLAVGYGGYFNQYYKVKNSWGTDWGDNGYILMSRNKNNNCGIATYASYPVME